MKDLKRTQRLLIVAAVLIAALAVLGGAWLLQSDKAPDQTPSEIIGSNESTTSTGENGAKYDPPAPSERVPAFVVAARIEDGVTTLSVDYIQFLTGDAAATAASERGDESPPPNDYYIVNDNTRIREFTVQEDISVVTVVQDDGTSDPGGHTLPLADWVARLEGPAGDALRSSFYWLTVSGDTITTIEQQYLP